MTTGLYTHQACLAHDTGHGHPERIQRLVSILRLLDDPIYAALERREAPPATREQLARVHAASYIDEVFAAIPSMGFGELDGDTVLSPGSGEAALRAAGAMTAAVGAVMTGELTNAFCAVRPPGHHAERDLAMGFCIFNNVAVGAAEAITVHGLSRVAIFDFDVHHGNGTEEIFAGDDQVLMVSTFQHPFYPYSGTEHPAANMCNVPVKAGMRGEGFREVVTDVWLPRLREFAPELIYISAGFDAHYEDDMASLGLVESDYAWVTEQLKDVARDTAQGRIVSMLEGGYSLSALARSVAAHIKVLAEL